MAFLPLGTEWVFIAVAAGVLIFGAKKIPELAKSIGKTSAEYEKAKIGAQKEIEKLKHQMPLSDQNVNEREKLEKVADKLGIDTSDKSNNQLRSAIQTEINRDKNAGA